MRLRLPQELNIDYFLHVVKGSTSTKRYLDSINRGATRDGINTKGLLNLPIPYPSLIEQKKIVEIVSSIISSENLVIEKLHENEFILESLKQSILSKAFRGDLGTNDSSEESIVEYLKVSLQAQLEY